MTIGFATLVPRAEWEDTDDWVVPSLIWTPKLSQALLGLYSGSFPGDFLEPGGWMVPMLVSPVSSHTGCAGCCVVPVLQCHRAAQHVTSCQPLLTLPLLPDAQPACVSPQLKVTENPSDSLCSKPPEQSLPTPFSASFPTETEGYQWQG